jgi:hypothetical protein
MTHGSQDPTHVVQLFFMFLNQRYFENFPWCRETSEGVVRGTGVYSVGMGPKDPALERFPDIIIIIKKIFRGLCYGLTESLNGGVTLLNF